MSIFETSDSAWSALTKQFEQMSGSPGTPLIVQSPTIFRPLTITGINPALALTRKLLLGDNQPAYHNLNQTAYTQSNKSVQKGYIQYLQTLLVEMTKRMSAPVDYDEIERLQKIYTKAQSALNIFVRDANADWALEKETTPGFRGKHGMPIIVLKVSHQKKHCFKKTRWLSMERYNQNNPLTRL